MLIAMIGLLTAVLASGATWAVNRREQHTTQRSELCEAAAEFLACLDELAQEANRMPATSPWLKRFNDALTRRAPQFDYLVDRLARNTLARDFTLKERRFLRAANRLILIAPEALLADVLSSCELLSAFRPADQQWKAQWQKARNRLQITARNSLGS